MNKKVIGFAIMLLSLIFIMGFSFMGWDFIGDLPLTWQIVWMLTAVVGFVFVMLGEKKGKYAKTITMNARKAVSSATPLFDSK